MKRTLGFLMVFVLGITAFGCNGDQGAAENAQNAETENNGQEEQAASDNGDNAADTPKNVIVMIGDGMGLGQMEVARLFEHGKEGELFMETLPHVALSRTYSADNIVTDSAAAGTTNANREKTNNGMLGVSPDGEKLTSIIDIFKEQGKTVGIVSTNTVTDTTPAGFIAKVESRSGQDEIARQLLEGKYDIALG